MSNELIRSHIRNLLATGMDPNEIAGEIEDEVEEEIKSWAAKNGWSRWGGSCGWRIETACSKCGSSLPGICGHENDADQIVLSGLAAVEATKKYNSIANGEIK